MLLTEARRAARIGSDGATVPPAEQDRALWDRHKVEKATEACLNALLLRFVNQALL